MKIIIPGKPYAKSRPRFSRRGKYVHTYSDQKDDEIMIVAEIAKQFKRAPLVGPLKLDVVFELSRPKSHYGTGRNAGKLKKSAPRYHTKRPDVDNFLKMIMDCMNGNVYHDDCQVVYIQASKQYSEDPKTIITIEDMNEFIL